MSSGTLTLILRGDLPGKKNRVIASKGRRGAYAGHTSEILKDLVSQAAIGWRGPAGRLPPAEHPDIVIALYLVNFKKDRDNIYTTLLDVLVKAGVIVDDCALESNGTHTLLPVQPVENIRHERAEITISTTLFRLPESRQAKPAPAPRSSRTKR